MLNINQSQCILLSFMKTRSITLKNTTGRHNTCIKLKSRIFVLASFKFNELEKKCNKTANLC